MDNGATRTVKGKSIGGYDSWRVTIVANTFDEIETLIKQLKSIDNTSNSDFSKIYSKLNQIEPKDENALYRRAFVDINLY